MSLVPVLPDNERHDWIRLARTQNVGPVTFAQQLKRFGSPAAALDALPEIARRAGRGRPVVAPAIDEIDAEIEATQRAASWLATSPRASAKRALSPYPASRSALTARPMRRPCAQAQSRALAAPSTISTHPSTNGSTPRSPPKA
jgi:DNA processing protein